MGKFGGLKRGKWVTFVAVMIGGLGIGAAIAGRPTAVDDIQIRSVPSTTGPTSAARRAEPTTAAPPPPVTTTTAVIEVATVPTTLDTAVSTTTAATTTVAATTATIPEPDRSTTRVLVANAGNRSGVARAQAAVLVTLGYARPSTNDAVQPLRTTTVYARAGHEDEALLLLADVGLPADRLRPFPNQPLTTTDDGADLILALGLDWDR